MKRIPVYLNESEIRILSVALNSLDTYSGLHPKELKETLLKRLQEELETFNDKTGNDSEIGSNGINKRISGISTWRL